MTMYLLLEVVGFLLQLQKEWGKVEEGKTFRLLFVVVCIVDSCVLIKMYEKEKRRKKNRKNIPTGYRRREWSL